MSPEKHSNNSLLNALTFSFDNFLRALVSSSKNNTVKACRCRVLFTRKNQQKHKVEIVGGVLLLFLIIYNIYYVEYQKLFLLKTVGTQKVTTHGHDFEQTKIILILMIFCVFIG
jgi:hypothetical protein